MKDITIDEEVLKYVTKEMYLEVYNNLKDKEHRILYEANQLRISLIRLGKEFLL